MPSTGYRYHAILIELFGEAQSIACEVLKWLISAILAPAFQFSLACALSLTLHVWAPTQEVGPGFMPSCGHTQLLPKMRPVQCQLCGRVSAPSSAPGADGRAYHMSSGACARVRTCVMTLVLIQVAEYAHERPFCQLVLRAGSCRSAPAWRGFALRSRK